MKYGRMTIDCRVGAGVESKSNHNTEAYKSHQVHDRWCDWWSSVKPGPFLYHDAASEDICQYPNYDLRWIPPQMLEIDYQINYKEDSKKNKEVLLSIWYYQADT